MEKLLIIYKSKHGSTEKYAYEIKKRIGGEICKVTNIKNIDFDKYDTIIYGARVFAGTIDGLSKFVQKFEEILKYKNFFVFAVGISDVNSIESLKVANNPKNLKAKIFYFRGSLDSKNLGFVEKMMIKMIKAKAMKIPEKERSEDEKVIIESFERRVDFFEKDAVDTLIKNIK